MALAQPVAPPRGIQAAILAVLTMAFAYATWRIVALAWTCDDAFISYRYARHLVGGQGLVFNAGERVEGYTNFLFTVAVAGAMRLGLEPRLASMILGVVAYIAVAVVLYRWSLRGSMQRRFGAVFPVAAMLWLAQDDLHTWATGGLETTVFAALSLGGLYVTTRNTRRPCDAAIGGMLLGLACLTRPDGLVFATIGALAPFFTFELNTNSMRRTVLARAATVAGIVGMVLTAFVAFKFVYYGRVLPTAFYAKSAQRHFYSQGLFYVTLYFMKHWAMALALGILPVTAWVARRHRAVRADALLAFVAFAVFTAYVAHSGGDYMFARRLVPALPFLFVFLDSLVANLAVPARHAAASAIVLGSYFPNPVFSPVKPEWLHGITEERVHYPEALIALRHQQADLARELLAGTHTSVAFAGGMCAFAYYSDLPNLVEPNGLTQYWIAEQSLLERGKIGHEKAVSLESLREHGVTLIVHHDLPPVSGAKPRFDEIIVGRMLRLQIVQYDEALMEHLADDPRVRFRTKQEVLREAQLDLSQMGCADAKKSYDVLFQTYFRRSPAGAEPLRKALELACHSGAKEPLEATH